MCRSTCYSAFDLLLALASSNTSFNSGHANGYCKTSVPVLVNRAVAILTGNLAKDWVHTTMLADEVFTLFVPERSY